ncbi:MAG: dTMP kinase [Betaproteobacteria bacterium]|nr:dTMP kinase [Betaproteobacteria bacterium]
MTARGKFITFEGIDGAGKSTHIPFVAEWIRARGHAVLATREPGGTPVGEALRELLLHERMQADTEALLMFASRREQVLTTIEPALAAGTWVACDRFTDSTRAYQCGGRGVDPARIATLADWVHRGLVPDLTLLFDAPVAVAQRRVAQGADAPDKFEREQAAFFERVRGAYLDLAAAEPRRIKVIDSSAGIEAIRGVIRSHLEALVP